MKIENVGAVVARGAGVVLLITGGATLLSLPPFEQSWSSTSGWTSFSPVAGNPPGGATFVSEVHSTIWLPAIAQAVAALVLILFSRPIGRWLAGGLGDD